MTTQQALVRQQRAWHDHRWETLTTDDLFVEYEIGRESQYLCDVPTTENVLNGLRCYPPTPGDNAL